MSSKDSPPSLYPVILSDPRFCSGLMIGYTIGVSEVFRRKNQKEYPTSTLDNTPRLDVDLSPSDNDNEILLTELLTLRKRDDFTTSVEQIPTDFSPILPPVRPSVIPVSAQPDAEMDDWREQVLFFETIKEELLQNASFLGKYVAIKNKVIVDSDINNLKLVRRVQRQFPGKVVLIAKVEKHPRVIEIPTPEFSR